MKSDWLKCENCPSDATRVWMACQPVENEPRVFTHVGYRCIATGQWYFDKGGVNSLPAQGWHVLAWQPLRAPVYSQAIDCAESLRSVLSWESNHISEVSRATIEDVILRLKLEGM